MELSRYIDLYYSGAVDAENEEKIRAFFMQNLAAPPIISLDGSSTISDSESRRLQILERRNKSAHDNKHFYKTFMDQQIARFKEKVKASRKGEKIINDFKPFKRNPNEILLDIDDGFIINKKGNWANLCILEYQEKLLEAIRCNQVVIIKGFTGCGKSTQIPQYIAVDCQNHGQSYNIIVTQPRRVAAKMLATRVAYELNCTVGSLVGYQIGLDRSRDSKLTKILYCTTGVLLQRLIMSSNFNFFTHIILDEIHERSADMDMLFLILKKKIFEDNFNARIILMSATCDVDLFSNYFTFPEYVISSDCFVDICPAVVEINSSRSGHGNVFRQEIFYLDDIVGKIGNLKFSYSENFLKYTDFDEFIMNNSDENIIFNKNYPLLHKILHEVVLGILFHGIEIHQIENQTRGTVLIFLPGLAEILELMNILKNSPYSSRYKWTFFILHSTVSLKEQTEVMKTPMDGTRHIILATNIAESSLTVPNVEYVIDYCLCKTLVASRQGYNMTYLALEWSSKSSADQRAGRTGRTNHGQVFRLIPNHFYQTLHDYEIPEFEKTPLENYVLKAKLIDQAAPPKRVLAFAINPPKLEDIEQAVLTLKRVGAFTVYLQDESESDSKERDPQQQQGQPPQEDQQPNQDKQKSYRYDHENGTLTALGYIMALLPLDIMLSKLVSLGLVFDVTYEAIVIAAAHCTTGFFMKNAYDPIHTYKSQLSWSNRSLSDSLSYLKSYRMYKTLEAKFHNNTLLAQKWCYKNNIEYQRLLELETLISEITTRLEMNLKIDLNFYRRKFYKKSEQDLILKVIIAGAFYPNYFTRDFINEELIQRYQSVINPENTVILTGFCKDTFVTALYIPFLKKMFEPCSNSIEFKVDGNVVFMIMDANNHEISIENEDHPLHLAYNSHINSQQIGQNKGAVFKNWSSFHETNIHSSVYLALAFKRFMRNQITLNRYRSAIESFHKKEILSKIKQTELLMGDDLKENSLGESNLVARVSQFGRKYILPRMANLPTSALYIRVRITNFLTPHLFYILYKHSYIEKMLFNLDILTSTLIMKLKKPTSQALMPFADGPKPNENGLIVAQDSQFEVGDFVIAPLNIERFNSIAHLVNDYDIQTYKYDDNYQYIMARAEIVNVAIENYKPMLCLNFVDFGITDTVPLNNVYKLNCRFKYNVEEVLVDVLSVDDVRLLENVQDIYDKLFSIPALVVRCELVRIKPFSAVEFVGNWMPQVKKFVLDYFAEQNFIFIAKIYAYLNDHLYVELYTIRYVSPPTIDNENAVEVYNSENQDHLSLNELLVQKKFAEFKLETEVCQQMSYRRDINSYHEAVSKDIVIDEEFALNFDGDVLRPTEFYFDVDQLTITNDRQFTHNLIRIRGPLSPLEVRFTGMSHLNSTKMVLVSTHSINSVSLEPDITSKHARLLVSGEINLSEINQNRLTLSNTTMMPNIIDFPAFMCLLFAPFVELHINKIASDRCFGLPEEFCGAICGVGFDPKTNDSYDPENDIDLFFDSNVNLEDIELVNLLRYQISQFFFTKEQHITCQNLPDSMKMNPTFNLEYNLFKRQKKCREILLQLLNRTRIKRRWFEETQTRTFPQYRWNLFNDVRTRCANREFEFTEFNPAMLVTINMKTAVFSPITIPILNPGVKVADWVEDVMVNLTNLEKDNFKACYDKQTKLYMCKLCMFCTFTEIDLQAHKCNTINTAHKEAVYLFKQYYPIWREEQNQLKQFTREIVQEEMKESEEKIHFHDIFDEQLGSTFNCLDFQIGIIGELQTDSTVVSKDLYDAPLLTSQDQKNMHMYQSKTSKNPFSLAILKKNVDHLLQQERASGGEQRSVTQITRSVYESLTDYFDDDEISFFISAQLVADE